MTLATPEPREPVNALAVKLDYCRMLAASGMLPAQYRDKPANLLYALEYADSLGLHPMQAITGVHVIEGKPSASAALISSLVRRAGHRLRVTGDDKSATAEIVRADDPTFTFRSTWTLERARAAGLLGKGTWSKYPAAMLKARAVTEVARDACEDALNGLHYTPEELGAVVDDAGTVHVEQARPAPVPAVVTRQEVEQAVVDEAQSIARDNTGEPVAPADREAVAGDWRALVEAETDLDKLRELYRQAGTIGADGDAVRAAVLKRRDDLLRTPPAEPIVEAAADVLEAGGEVTLDGEHVVVEAEVDPFAGTVDADPDTLEVPGASWPETATPPDLDPSDAGVSPRGRRKGSGREAFEKAKADLAAKQAAKQGDA